MSNGCTAFDLRGDPRPVEAVRHPLRVSTMVILRMVGPQPMLGGRRSFAEGGWGGFLSMLVPLVLAVLFAWLGGRQGAKKKKSPQ